MKMPYVSGVDTTATLTGFTFFDEALSHADLLPRQPIRTPFPEYEGVHVRIEHHAVR